MELTPAELTVLGLMAERPMHGYDIERVIEQRGVRQWTDIGFSSIYYLIAKLEKRGLVMADEAMKGAKSRRTFRVTDEGRHAATAAARAFISEARPVPAPLLVGVANLDLLTKQEYLDALQSRLEQIDERLAAVEAAEKSQGDLPHAASEVFSYSLLLLQAEKAWVTERVEKHRA